MTLFKLTNNLLTFLIVLILSFGTFGKSVSNANVIKGKMFNKSKNVEIFSLSKVLIYNHEVSPKSKLKNTPDLISYNHGEKLNKTKVYTACYGNIDVRDSNGKFIRYIQKDEKFTVEQCNEIFKNYFIWANKRLYNLMTDSEKNNYYYKLHYLEVPILIDIIWHNGPTGSLKVIKAMVKYAKYRDENSLLNLFSAIDNTLKKSDKFDFTGRRENCKKILQYIFNEKLWKY